MSDQFWNNSWGSAAELPRQTIKVEELFSIVTRFKQHNTEPTNQKNSCKLADIRQNMQWTCG